MSDDEVEYELALPFTCVTSAGGPYDDQAFSAGYQMGLLDRTLAGGLPFPFIMAVPPDLVAQADLIAMRHGCVTQVAVDEEGFWAEMVFTKAQRPEGLAPAP